MAGRIDFNRGKFKELVVYLSRVADQEGDEGFGMVKLNKLLYRADFEAYRLLGHAITGETYEKQVFGPVARDLLIVLDELAAEGRLYWQRIPRGPHTAKVPTTATDEIAQPDIRQFSDDEREVIEDTLRELATYGGKAVSDWSHENSPGWRLAEEYGDEIPYYTAVAPTKPIPPSTVKRAKRFAEEEGLLKR